MQNTQKLHPHADLFYERVLLGGKVEVRAMLDSGSMACSLSSKILPRLLEEGVLKSPSLTPSDVVLIECGGSRTKPLGVCELEMEVYGCCVAVPTLGMGTEYR